MSVLWLRFDVGFAELLVWEARAGHGDAAATTLGDGRCAC